jgi:hypothetical protein
MFCVCQVEIQPTYPVGPPRHGSVKSICRMRCKRVQTTRSPLTQEPCPAVSHPRAQAARCDAECRKRNDTARALTCANTPAQVTKENQWPPQAQFARSSGQATLHDPSSSPPQVHVVGVRGVAALFEKPGTETRSFQQHHLSISAQVCQLLPALMLGALLCVCLTLVLRKGNKARCPFECLPTISRYHPRLKLLECSRQSAVYARLRMRV